MKIAVLGLGYVGIVSAACMADRGHRVVGADVNRLKIVLINRGSAPVIEPNLTEILGRGVASGNLRVTDDACNAVIDSDLSLICVGTPSRANGNPDLQFIENVCKDVGRALRRNRAFHTVVIRSTVLPGTTEQILTPLLEGESGRKAGTDFDVFYNPEFLREGSAVYDFCTPSKIVIGGSENRPEGRVRQLYEGFPGSVIRCSMSVAEMIKYTDNAWHALKITFANEMGRICKALDLDSHKVMDIFCEDTKLNLSAAYLRPGFAFGGSCLPKDLRALSYVARSRHLATPMLNSLLVSNSEQINLALDAILNAGSKSVGLLGLSFKASTDDLRESPQIELVERLIGKGIDVYIYDKDVNISRLMGANRDYVLRTIPHIARLMVDRIEDVVAHCEVVVVGNNSPEFVSLPTYLKPEHKVIDLAYIGQVKQDHRNYQGLSW